MTTDQRTIFLREWRELRGVPAKDLAEKTNVDVTYIMNIEAGRRTNPSASFLLACSEAPGLTANDLFSMPPKKEASHG